MYDSELKMSQMNGYEINFDHNDTDDRHINVHNVGKKQFIIFTMNIRTFYGDLTVLKKYFYLHPQLKKAALRTTREKKILFLLNW